MVSCSGTYALSISALHGQSLGKMSCLYPVADCSGVTADGLRYLGCPSRPKVLRLDGIPAGYLTGTLLDRRLLDSVLIYIVLRKFSFV